MKLLLGVTGGAEWAGLVSCFEGKVSDRLDDVEGHGDDVIILTNVLELAEVEKILDSFDAGIIYLFYQAPECVMASLLKAQSDFKISARLVEEYSNTLLVMQRKNRQKLKLINLQHVYAAPKMAQYILLENNINLKDFSAQPDVGTLELLVASQYVAQSSNTKSSQVLLHSSSLPIADEPAIPLNVGAIYEAKRRDVQQIQLLKEQNAQLELASAQQVTQGRLLTEVEAERDLILTQLHMVQEELEQCYLNLKEMNHKEGLNDKQHNRQLKKLESQIKQLKSQLASSSYQVAIHTQELNSVRKSLLWKTGSPVRLIKKVLRKERLEQFQSDCALILTSEYFDIDWYLNAYKDVAESGMNPAEHYLKHGAAEGRYPSPQFDGNWYLDHYPDVAESGMNPLLHFIKFGQAEGRQASVRRLMNESH